MMFVDPRYFDQWGTLDKIVGRDGGDSCAYFFTFYLLIFWGVKIEAFENNNFFISGGVRVPSMEHFELVGSKHHPAPGVVIRHPDVNRDASDWDRGSWDQARPAIMAWGWVRSKELRKFLWGHLFRGFLFMGNTRHNGATKKNHGKVEGNIKRNYAWKLPDVTWLPHWAVIIRAANVWLLWPLLIVTDLSLLFRAYYYKYIKPDWKIVTNFALELLYAERRLPTPISFWAMKVNDFDKLADRIIDHLDDFGPNGIAFLGKMFKEVKK